MAMVAMMGPSNQPQLQATNNAFTQNGQAAGFPPSQQAILEEQGEQYDLRRNPQQQQPSE